MNGGFSTLPAAPAAGNHRARIGEPRPGGRFGGSARAGAGTACGSEPRYAYDLAVSPADDGVLVRAAAEGDQAAWDALVKRFSGLVWSIARAHRLGSADAADVCQTAWLRLVENLSRIRDPDRVGAWLAATARNECLRVIRRAGRQVPTDLDADTDLEADEDVAPPVDTGLLTGERDADLWRAFSAISERCQALLRLLITDPPQSYEDIGEQLDMPVGSIGPTRARCLDHLRRKAGITGGPGDSQ